MRPLSISGNVGYTYNQKKTTIWLLRGDCAVKLGDDTIARSAEMVLWIDFDQARVRSIANGSYRVFVYMEGQVEAQIDGLVTQSEDSRTRNALTRINPSGTVRSIIKQEEWLCAFYSLHNPHILTRHQRNTPGDLPNLYWRGLNYRQVQQDKEPDPVSRTNYAKTQVFGEGTPTTVRMPASTDDKTNTDGKTTDGKIADSKTADGKTNTEAMLVAAAPAAVTAEVSPAVGQSAGVPTLSPYPSNSNDVQSNMTLDSTQDNASGYNSSIPDRIPSSEDLRSSLPTGDEGPILPADQVCSLEPGFRRVCVYPRTDIPISIHWDHLSGSNTWTTVINHGVTMVIMGVSSQGPMELSADKIIIWTNSLERPDLNSGHIQASELPLELYMEGNIIFCQGNRTIKADKMFYDVKNRRGTIIQGQLSTPIEEYSGKIRIGADVIHQVNDNEFYAERAFVTSSQMGVPSYRMETQNVLVRIESTPQIDPLTGLQAFDHTGRPIYNEQRYLHGGQSMLFIGDLPIFYWPVTEMKLEKSTMYIDSLRFRSDGVFGVQMYTDWNAYELFGIKNPAEGSQWRLNLDPMSKRGIGHGTDYKVNTYLQNGWLAGTLKGDLDFWGIYDWGEDNLGLGRRDVDPEKKYRFKINSNFDYTFGNDINLHLETGILSDRDFMPEYFRDDWYRQKSPETGLQLRQSIYNSSWDISADVKTNDFYTQTQQLPRADHFWIGESLFGDILTWYEHTSVGYYQLKRGSYPEAIENQAMFDYLPWEQNCDAGRFATRHEIDYPFQLGPVKIVPYLMGEAAYWTDTPSSDSVERYYGQAGIRMSLPFWKVNPCVRSQMYNLHGLAHKASLDVEWYVGESNVDMQDLPMFDQLDDQSITQYRHTFWKNTFGMQIPWQFDERSYALRSGLGNAVAAPGTEILDDMNVVRVSLNQRWQTKRGPEGQRRIIDWLTFDTGVSFYPNSSRDNFGETMGLLDYKLRWHVGDRFTVLSSGLYDFFPGGLKYTAIGGQLDKPGRGNIYAGFHFLSGPVDNVIFSLSANYWLSPKWYASVSSDIDLQGQGNIGQRIAITRVGEALLVRAGVYVDATRDDFGVSLTIEPRFLPKGSLARRIGVAPAGAYGLE